MVVKINYFCLLFLFILALSSVSAFQFEGFTKYTNGSNMTGVNVSLKIYEMVPGQPPSLNITLSNFSDSDSFFTINVDDGLYGNENFTFKPVLIKYLSDNYTAEYIGNSLPDFPYDEFKNLGKVTFYLKSATTIYLSAVGDSHWADTVTEDYNTSLASDYKIGLEVLNESGSLKWAYINESECLVVLDSSKTLNYSQCDLNITNIKDFEFVSLGPDNAYYFLNSTQIEKCSVTFGATVDFNCTISKDISDKNFDSVSGIEYTTFGGPGYDNLFISGTNSSGNHRIEKYNLTSLAWLDGEEIKDFAEAKMELLQDSIGVKLYFMTNDSKKSSIYECVPEGQIGPMQCFESANFSSLISFDGLAYNSFNSQWYYSVNSTNNLTNFSFMTLDYKFNYQLKDIALGYPLEENFNDVAASNYTVYAPANRNYSLMIYPQGGPSFPARVNINDIENGTVLSNCGSTIDENLFVNCTALNLSTNLVKLNGYAIYNESLSEQNYTDFKVIAYLLEAGDMVFKDMTLPGDMGNFGDPNTREMDTFTTSTGFFNMTLPGSALGSNLLLFALATFNNSGNLTYVGGFNEITLGYNSSGATQNFTLYELMGNESNLEFGFGGQDGIITTNQKSFNLVNESGSMVSGNAFIQAQVDYSSVTGSNATFSWMFDSSDGSFDLPLLNEEGIKKIEIYSSNVAPLKTSIENSILDNNETYNITLRNFKPYDPDNSSDDSFSETIAMDLYKSSTECSVPNPTSSCRLTPNAENFSEFNPLSVVLGGAEIDFEIRKTTNNITVRYINVDLIASGPPDAMFDDSSNTSGGSLEEAWRFGSQGPEIYDSILLGVPYNNSLINESASVYVNITKLYADNDLSDILWQQGTNTTSQLTGTDYEDYALSSWVGYLNGTGVLCNGSDENLTSGLCYKDTDSDMIWFKIPHFSGISPKITGSAVSSGGDDTSISPTSGSSGGGSNTVIYRPLKTDLAKGYTKNYYVGWKSSFTLNNESHEFKVNSISNTSVTFTLSSDPITDTLSIGDSKKYDIEGDNIYDLLVIVNGKTGSLFGITLAAISEAVPESEQQPSTGETNQEEQTNQNKSTEYFTEDRSVSWFVWIILMVIVAAVVGYMIYKHKSKKKK